MLIELRRATQSIVQSARKTQRDWLAEVLTKTGLTPNALAEKSKISASTLSRFLDETSESELRPLTISRICQATGLPPPAIDIEGDGDVSPVRYAPEDFAPPSAENQRLRTYKVTSGELKAAGIEKGDILVVDQEASPRPGQLVCALIFQPRSAAVETVIRWYEPPYLVSISNAPEHRRPLMIDHETVTLRGVVVRQLRNRDVA